MKILRGRLCRWAAEDKLFVSGKRGRQWIRLKGLKLYFLDVMKVKNHLKVVLSCLLDMMEGLRVFKSIFSTPFQIFTNRARYKTHAKRVINHFVNDRRTD